MNAGMAMTTTHAPSVNFETRNTMVAIGGDDGAEAVDGGAALPARRPRPPPVHDEAGLREREADEDADGEQRDQRVGVAVDGDEERAREHGEHHDPGGEDLTVAPDAKRCGR